MNFTDRHRYSRRPTAALAGTLTLLSLMTVPPAAGLEMPALEGTVGQMHVVEVSVGFAGRYKTGAWTPVRLTVRDAPDNLPAQLILSAADDEGIPCQFENEVTELPRPESTGDRTFEGYVCFGRRPANLQIELVIGDRTVTATWQPDSDDFVASNQQWVLMIGAKPAASARQKSLASAARLLDRQRGQEVRVLSLSDADQLPSRWFGFDGFDLVVVCGSQPDVWQRVRSDQWRALDEWTRLGGQLMLSVGEESERLLSGDSPVKRFIPGSFAERVVVPTTTNIEEFAGATDRLDVILQSGRWPSRWQTSTGQVGLPMALILEPRGRVIVAESFGSESIPLVTNDLHGLGQAMFVAFDLDSEPLRQWSGFNKLMTRLLRLTVDQGGGEQVESTSGRMAHLGFGDISGQLRTALEQFPGVRLVPFALIAVFAACYVLLIGPIEYFGLRKLKDKMYWTWLSFPAIVLVICGLSLFLMHRWKGTQPKVNQVDLIDWDAESSVVRGRNWTHFFSPSSVAFDCEVSFQEPVSKAAENAETLLLWDGLPGQSFGGMDASSPFRPHQQPYQIRLAPSRRRAKTGGDARSGAHLNDFNLPIASSRAIRAEWWSFSAPAVRSDLRQEADTYLSGTITNPFDVDLRDCAVLFDRWYDKLGTVEANSTITIDGTMSPSSVKSQLIGRVVQQDSHTIAPWQQTSFDVPRIMQMVMFQRVAGGRGYTGLVHRHDRHLDFTEQLAAGRAVLVGHIRSPATLMNTADFPAAGRQHWTYSRLLLPVLPFEAARSSDTLNDSVSDSSP